MESIAPHSCDVLVIGGGIAGLYAAITAREAGRQVILMDKGYAGKSGCSIMASGQMNTWNPHWGRSYDAVFNRIRSVGENLINPQWTEVMIRDAWARYKELCGWGVEFSCSEDEFMDYMKTVHGMRQEGDDEEPEQPLEMIPMKHREMPVKMRKYAAKIGVKLIDRTMAYTLLKSGGAVSGALGFDIETAEPVAVCAKAVILAAGRNCFRSPGMHNAGQTGDGDALAYRAGADISGKEFPDLHTSMARNPEFKGNGELYPAYWKFVDGEGKPIPMFGFDLSMASVIHAGKGPVMWDFEHATDEDIERMENYIQKRGCLYETQRGGLNYNKHINDKVTGGAQAGGMAEQTAGVWPTDLNGASTVPGLYAAGDNCCTWAWGAVSEGAPPGILPACVTGQRTGLGAAEFSSAAPGHELDAAELSDISADMLRPLTRKTGFDPHWVFQQLQNAMLPYYVIHIKRADRLNAALTNVCFLRDHMCPRLKANDAHELRLCHETRNMILNAEMILRASLAREESRGWHYREDFPVQDDENWLAWLRLRQGKDGMEVFKEPIPREWLPDKPAVYKKKWLAWEQEDVCDE